MHNSVLVSLTINGQNWNPKRKVKPCTGIMMFATSEQIFGRITRGSSSSLKVWTCWPKCDFTDFSTHQWSNSDLNTRWLQLAKLTVANTSLQQSCGIINYVCMLECSTFQPYLFLAIIYPLDQFLVLCT